ncbi:uncharacterized protein LOC129720774 [Wyeomyia smithii]|uniref:uncharacterized protein LOC129720774 n=1 Tax=Wyeomyia smithii TaxID=174621 RepID=UPI002467D64E|nr:uncharacterized protein LOC129720774 [Wyeomyia smithii]
MGYQFWILSGALVVFGFLGGASALTSCVMCHSTWSLCVSTNLPQPSECDPAANQCYTMLTSDNAVVRGCLVDPIASACTNSTDSSCVTCTGAGCNNAPWLKCHNCDSTNTANCTTEQPERGGKFCSIFSSDDRCYTKIEGDNVTRGCLSDFADPQTACDNDVCTICSGELCNKLSVTEMKNSSRCLQCNSIDATCVDGTAAPKKCITQQDNCYTRVTGGLLERGCLSTLPAVEQTLCNRTEDATCTVCDSAGCNTDHWLQCYKCNQASDATCAEQQTNATGYCQYWKSNNRCYERMEGANLTRGCENDLGLNVDACLDSRECRTCSTDGCNREAPAVRQCLQCNSEVDDDDDEKCLLGTTSSGPCAKALAGKCYSKVVDDGHVIRGCEGNLTLNETQACTGKTCSVCGTDNCNRDVFPMDRLRCYQCETNDTNRSCAEELSGELQTVYCQKYKEDDECFTRIVNGTLERGCQSSLAESACEDLTDNECKTCTTNNCNGLSEQQLRGSAEISTISALLVTLSVIVVALAS